MTKTETSVLPSGTIFRASGSSTRLVAAVRGKHGFQHYRLTSMLPAQTWEEARTEAEGKFPGVVFVIPALGELP